MIHQIAADPEERAAEVARAIAGFSPTAIQRGLEYVREASGKDGETAGEIARRIRGAVLGSRDFEEGLRAFREKRAPRWPSLLKFGRVAHSIEGSFELGYKIVGWRCFTFMRRAFSIVTTPPKQRSMLC